MQGVRLRMKLDPVASWRRVPLFFGQGKHTVVAPNNLHPESLAALVAHPAGLSLPAKIHVFVRQHNGRAGSRDVMVSLSRRDSLASNEQADEQRTTAGSDFARFDFSMDEG